MCACHAQVRQLAQLLQLPWLAQRAELAAVAAPWEAPHRQDLVGMLGALTPERVRALLHHPTSAATGELQVRCVGVCSSRCVAPPGH